MAQAQFSGDYDLKFETDFVNVQNNLFLIFVEENQILLNNPTFELTLDRDQYISEYEVNFENEFFKNFYRFESTINGELDFDLPLKDRTITSVEFELFDSITGDSLRSATYDDIQGLTLSQFLDKEFDSVEYSFRGNDKIIGVDSQRLTLNGFKGDDQIFLESNNRGIGGEGEDEFVVSKNTRNAEILDFDPREDTIVVADDSASRYSLVAEFGQTLLREPTSGSVLVSIESDSDFDKIVEMISVVDWV